MEPQKSSASGKTQQDSDTYEQGTRHNKFDAAKEVVAGKLRNAASAIVEKTGETAGLASYGQQASDWLNHSADYLSQLDLQRVKADVEKEVRVNPGRSLVIAGAAGLLVGLWLRRR